MVNWAGTFKQDVADLFDEGGVGTKAQTSSNVSVCDDMVS